MKVSLLSLSFLLFAVAHQLSFAIGEPVLDTQDHPLLPYAEYYIYPAIWGPTGGGLRPGNAGNSSLPVNVLKSFSEVDLGEPLKFLPLPKIGIVPTNTLINIEFTQTPEGVSSGNWITVKDLGEAWTVGIGGPQDHEGYPTLTGFFKIHKAQLGYTLSFLPHLNGPLYGPIGTYIDDDRKWRLVVTNGKPYEVVFIKANIDSS
ncbi:hypothetical protein L6164_016616 [Bauhinia variegata]|uniref:Uncharacterized protein n=1 Tax=Bauhinia variegata TaxID=167791 RepID=A0ACB9NS94_BAUVA|nr:hypothetical protein L6164_016616 [Bauhinia variegata]